MLGKNYHAVRTAYLKNKLDNMVGGYFGTKKGKNVVYVTQDPADKSVSATHKKVYGLDTPKGRFYAALVSEYQSIKRDHDQLLKEWHDLYKRPLPTYKFPINSDPGPHNLTYHKFLCDQPYQNPTPITTPFYYKKEVLRSKNEAHMLELLDAKKIPYKVEPRIPLGMENIRTYNNRYPDTSCGLIEVNRSFYLEVVGGMDLKGYKRRNSDKFLDYEEAGYRDMRDFVTIQMGNEWDDEYIEGKLNAAIDLMCPPVE